MLDPKKVKIGIAPIAWTEDDMPEMGAENSFLQTISEIALSGYVGTEIGCQYPRNPAVLNEEFGRRGSEEGMTCDARKGNSEIKVNPLDAKTLSGITYTANGKIKSSDPIIDEDINIRLNLNGETTSLSENRKQVLDSLLRDIKKRCGTGDISLYCQRRLEKIMEMDDPKIPYAGILIWWLKKHIK